MHDLVILFMTYINKKKFADEEEEEGEKCKQV